MYQFINAIPGFLLILMIVSFFSTKYATFGKKPTIKRWKLAGTYFLAAMFMAVIANVVTPDSYRQEQANKASIKVEQQKIDSSKKELSSNKFANALNLDTIEQANEVEKALSSVEITDVKKIDHDEGLDDTSNGTKGYRLSTNNSKNIILYMNPNKTVQSIRYAGAYLYNNSQAIEPITDYTLTTEEKSLIQLATEKAVEKILKSPATAKFSSFNDYKFNKKQGIATIEGYVDSQNGFGAMIRSNFKAQYDMNNGGQIIHFTFDGNQLF